jgi:uncharacterized protein involved in exopolysaccharide biosynthesis
MSETAQSYQETREVVAAAFDIVKRVLSRWPILAAGVVLGIGVAVLLPRFMPPIYRAQTTLMYRNTVTPESVVLDRQRIESWRDKGTRYRELATTRTNLERVVRDLNLYPELVASQGIEAAAERLRGDLSINMPSGTLITVSYSTTDSSKLLPVLERIAQDLKQQPVVDSVQEAKDTKAFLDTQYTAAATELAEKESLLASFIASHPEFAQAERGPGGGIGARLQATEGSPGESRGTSLRRQIARLEARLAGLDGSPGAPALVQTRIVPADQQRIDGAQRVASTAAERLAQLRAQFTEAHPDVQAAKADLAKAQQELTRARQAARTEALPDLAPAQAATPETRAALGEQLKRLRSELAYVDASGPAERKTTQKAMDFVDSVVALETEWTSHLRDVENARERHASIGQRLFQADTVVKLVSLAGTGQIVTLDAAYAPQLPSARGRLGTMFKGFVGMSSIGALVALALTLMDDRIFRIQALRAIAEPEAILATIPQAKGGAK